MSTPASIFATSATRGLRRVRGSVVAALVALGLMACQSAPTTGYAHLNAEITEEMSKVGLGPGDIFEVTVYGEEKLSRVLRVAPDGVVHFPLIQQIQVAGLTTTEIEDLIRSRLQDGFIRDPSVTVFVKEYNSKKVFILGEVARPGTFPYTSKMNIVEAVTLAGGFKDSANSNYVVVVRREGGKEQRIPIPVEKITEGLATNFDLLPGDIIFVPDTLL